MKASTGKSRRATARKQIDDSRQLALPGSLPVDPPGAPKESTSPSAAKTDQTADPVFQKALEILRKEFPASSTTEVQPSPQTSSPVTIPARMLNEFVYCQRLFYYEFVEGVFVENADTLRGGAIHKKVDAGKGDRPPAAKLAKAAKKSDPPYIAGPMAASMPHTPLSAPARARPR